MNQDQSAGLTGLGKFVSFLLIAGLIGVGGYVFWAKSNRPVDEPTEDSTNGDHSGAADKVDAPPLELAETKAAPPRLPAPVAYKMTGDVVDIELSRYAGYAGLIVANGGLEPGESSYFKQKHGFGLRIKLSEEESWAALNQGKMAASATTADVLAVYGRQFDVVVPAQIGFSRGADGVVVRSDIKRINQLKGQVLVVPQFTEADFFIRYLAQEAGLPVNMLKDLSNAPDSDKLNLVFTEDGDSAGDVFLADVKSGARRLAGCVTWAPKTTEVADASGGKAHVLTTNRNLLIIADVLVVNKQFAQANPKIVAGLVDGLLEGNRRVRGNPDQHLDVIAKAFKWDRNQAKAELSKVHLSNGPENLAFFSGAIDAAGSFSGIFNSAVLAYGEVIRDPTDGDRFVDASHLKALESAGAFKSEQVAIAPIRTASSGAPLESNPLLSKNIRFFFEPNSSKLDQSNPENLKMLGDVKQLLQVSPGSRLLLRGHVDPSRKEEFRKQGGEEYLRKMSLQAMQLSKDRAAEIQRLLIEKEKIDPARLDTVGRGWEEPAGTTPQENMRVEVQWFTLE